MTESRGAVKEEKKNLGIHSPAAFRFTIKLDLF